MHLSEISVPEVYMEESQDFRFFIQWFTAAMEKITSHHANFFDMYDPLRIPADLLWMLADTMGYKYDNRLPVAFNRLVLVYFMSMIRNRGSRDGITLAAQTNLAQFNLLNQGKEKEILFNRLEDTSLPANAVYVNSRPGFGFIDVVYLSEEVPLDACIEYVRPAGMYLFQNAGVRMDARTKIHVDARLTQTNDIGMSFGPTHVGQYTREDYSRIQRTRQSLDPSGANPAYRIQQIPAIPQRVQPIPPNTETFEITEKWWIQREDDEGGWETVFGPFQSEARARAHFDAQIKDKTHDRNPVWYRNSEFEGSPAPGPETPEGINPGFRALHSLQIANNQHIVRSLLPKIFSIGFGPQDVDTEYAPDYLNYPYRDKLADGTFVQPEWNVNGRYVSQRAWNLRLNRNLERDIDEDVYTTDDDRTENIIRPRPAVNPVMSHVGDAISMNPENEQFIIADGEGNFPIVNTEDI